MEILTIHLGKFIDPKGLTSPIEKTVNILEKKRGKKLDQEARIEYEQFLQRFRKTSDEIAPVAGGAEQKASIPYYQKRLNIGGRILDWEGHTKN